MIGVISDDEVTMDALSGKTVAVIGYGSQGRAQSLCMRDSGVDVVIGLRENGKSWSKAEEDGQRVLPIAQAVKEGDVVHILVPDEVQSRVYAEEVADNLSGGKTLCFSHGFNVVYGNLELPDDVDVIMVAPKSPGTEERKRYLEGFGVPALVAVKADVSGKAKDTALAMAKAMGFTRAGVLECTFEDETYSDLLGEQAVLCGGVTELIKAGFETLVDAGYPPELAYFECLNELKLIVDLIYEGGMAHMWDVVSNTAEYGGRRLGPKVITADTRTAMRELLADIESGKFAREWVEEFEAGLPNMNRMRKEELEHPIEMVGKEVRALFKRA